MAQITITIPDAVVPRVLDAMAETYGYTGEGTKAAFARQQLIQFVRQTVIAHEANAASRAATEAARDAAERELELS